MASGADTAPLALKPRGGRVSFLGQLQNHDDQNDDQQHADDQADNAAVL